MGREMHNIRCRSSHSQRLKYQQRRAQLGFCLFYLYLVRVQVLLVWSLPAVFRPCILLLRLPTQKGDLMLRFNPHDSSGETLSL